MGGVWKEMIIFPHTLNMLLFKEVINYLRIIFSLGPSLNTWLNIRKNEDQDFHVIDTKKEKSCISLA